MSLCIQACKPKAEPPPVLKIFAASSLKEALTAVGAAFKKAHPHIVVSFHFAGTQELRLQIENGAEADIFASADMRHMQALVTEGHIEAPVSFARNEPVLVVQKEGAPKVQNWADLPKANRIVVGAREVPIGRYTEEILERSATVLGDDFRTQVEAHVVSKELNVRQVLAKVLLGEAEAGIVYRTDALAHPNELRVIAIPPNLKVVADYPIGILTLSTQHASAEQWVSFVLSKDGRDILSRAGFSVPIDGHPKSP